MVDLIYLAPGEQMPELHDDEPWIAVEASDDGRFFGTGWARTPSGEGVFYASLPESDISLDAVLAAAIDWVTRRDIPRIWVQTTR